MFPFRCQSVKKSPGHAVIPVTPGRDRSRPYLITPGILWRSDLRCCRTACAVCLAGNIVTRFHAGEAFEFPNTAAEVVPGESLGGANP